MKWMTMLGLFLAAAACAQPQPGDGAPPGAPADTPPAGVPDAARLAELEERARALANPAGCEASGGCRTAPVGNRPCGGPREYVVYCAATTDSAALFRALGELAAAEDAYNRANDLVSTCEFRMPPETVAEGGVCRAAD